MLHSQLAEVLHSQIDLLDHVDQYIDRNIKPYINEQNGFATIITGVRRSGKSTLLKTMMQNYDGPQQYLHFDDPRLLNFEVLDFYTIEELTAPDTKYYYDEIHQIPQWEKYVRHATEKQMPLIITGSNAAMLSTELATLLTGRHLSYELFPFDYREYKSFHQLSDSDDVVADYLHHGGFPEYLISKNDLILQQLLTDIIQRDIVARYKVRDSHALMQITMHLMNNISRPYTLNKLKKTYGIGSVNTVASFLQYLENAYLIFSIRKYDNSYKKQLVNEKKAYSIDTGFIRANTIKIQEDRGRLLENLVFLALRRRHSNIYYYRERGECDFVITEHQQPIQCYQVCYTLDRHNQDREVHGLLEAMTFFNHQQGYMVTMNQQDEIRKEGKTITIITAHDLLSGLYI